MRELRTIFPEQEEEGLALGGRKTGGRNGSGEPAEATVRARYLWGSIRQSWWVREGWGAFEPVPCVRDFCQYFKYIF